MGRARRAGGRRLEVEQHPISGFARRIDDPLLEALVVARDHRSLQRLAALVPEAEPG